MKFSRVIGNVDKKKVKEAEDKLSAVCTELSLTYDNKAPGSGIGGDPFIFQLFFPVEQICVGDTSNMDAKGGGFGGKPITTAATDGKRYYWNVDFVNGLSRQGLRLVIAHEAFHAIYMHPQRRGGRIPWLWNIAVDYIVNYNIMADLKARGLDHVRMFSQHLGEYIELKKYADVLAGKVKLSKKDEDKKVFFADPNLADGMKKPEAIYEFLYNQIPKCPKCGKPTPGEQQQQQQKSQQAGGQQQSPQQGQQAGGPQPGKKGKKGQKGQSQDGQGQDGQGQQGKGQGQGQDGQQGQGGGQDGQGQGQSDQQGQGGGHACGDHDHDGDGEGQGQGQGQSQGHQHGGGHSCDHSHDPSAYGALVDDHMDAEASQDELAKRLADAAEMSRRLAGRVPGGMEDEIGHLLAPKLRWQDVIRSKLQKVRQGHGRNDYNRFKTRPLMAGMMVPRRKDFFAKFRVLLDTSGSMGQEDITWGISQLQAIDERGEGSITPADCTIYWDDTVEIKKANREELSKVKVVGRGGTMFGAFFDEYEKRLGAADFIIMITDGYLLEDDLANMKRPNVPVYWILTSSHNFNPPFGKVYDLRNE